MSEWDLEEFAKEVIDLACHRGLFRFFGKLDRPTLKFEYYETGVLGVSASVHRKEIGKGVEYSGAFYGSHCRKLLLQALQWLESHTEKDCCREARKQRVDVRKRGHRYVGPIYSSGYHGPFFIWNAAKGETYTEQDKFIANSSKCNRCGKALDEKEDC